MAIVRIRNKNKRQAIPILLIDPITNQEESFLLGARKFTDVDANRLSTDCFNKAAKGILKLTVKLDENYGNRNG